MKQKITLKKIAKEFGVSISTVSKALKDSHEISEEVREKIKAFADFYNYKPNSLALQLRSQKTSVIGVIVPEIVHHFFSTVIDGIEQYANKKGYNVMVCISNESYQKEVSNINEDDNNEKKLENNKDETNIKENLEVSISEMDLVIQQLRSCFNPRAGTQIIGDEMVKISAKIDRAANVRKDTVQIIDTNISKSNPYYKAITESAVATLYNPLCSQLKLPLNKYESWKDLKITIDYSWIKN